MSTRRLRFFVTPEEASEWTAQLVDDLSLFVIVRSKSDLSRPDTLETPSDFSFSMSHGGYADTVYFSGIVPDDEALDVSAFSLPELGWVQWTLPIVSDGVLLMSELGSKSDWFDSTSHEIRENISVHVLFQRIKASLIRKLNRGVWYVPDDEHIPLVEERLIYYSSGTHQWIETGGVLKYFSTKSRGKYVLSR